MVSENLSWEAKIDNVFKRVSRILGMLKKTFHSRAASLLRNLYVSLVRPHLEYAVQTWNLYLEKDIINIEKVKIRASKIHKGSCNLSNEERLKVLNITSLKDRMVRDDLIGMYKVVSGLDEIEWTESTVPRSNVDFTGPTQELRGNKI